VQLLRYAGASGDFNLIHTDVETARAVGLGDVIAHGMLSMGFLGQYLANVAGPYAVRRLNVRFKAMVRLGDVLTCTGTVQTIAPSTDGGQLVTAILKATNQRGETVTEGDGDFWLTVSDRGKGEQLDETV
jgi:acyl dehydratase